MKNLLFAGLLTLTSFSAFAQTTQQTCLVECMEIKRLETMVDSLNLQSGVLKSDLILQDEISKAKIQIEVLKLKQLEIKKAELNETINRQTETVDQLIKEMTNQNH